MSANLGFQAREVDEAIEVAEDACGKAQEMEEEIKALGDVLKSSQEYLNHATTALEKAQNSLTGVNNKKKIVQKAQKAAQGEVEKAKKRLATATERLTIATEECEAIPSITKNLELEKTRARELVTKAICVAHTVAAQKEQAVLQAPTVQTTLTVQTAAPTTTPTAQIATPTVQTATPTSQTATPTAQTATPTTQTATPTAQTATPTTQTAAQQSANEALMARNKVNELRQKWKFWTQEDPKEDSELVAQYTRGCPEQRCSLIDRKFSIVGGSVRWMFGLSLEEAEKDIELWILRCDDYKQLLNRTSGSAATKASNHLLAREEGTSERQIQSRFIMLRIAEIAAKKLVKAARNSAMADNPAWIGWVFQLEFFAYLHNAIELNLGLKLITPEHTTVKWPTTRKAKRYTDPKDLCGE